MGLPLAVAFSRKLDVIGFDLSEAKVQQYRSGFDATGEIGDTSLANCSASFTSDPDKLKEARCFIVAVPTPVKAETSGSEIRAQCQPIGRPRIDPGSGCCV